MSKRKRKNGRCNARAIRSSTRPRIIDIKSEDLARYVRQAESQALPTIKDLEVSAGAAIFLVAQYAQALISGNPHITLESATTITDSVVAIWQTGSYHPSAEYPFTLEETLQDLKDGLNAKVDYSMCFQPFAPSSTNAPVGIGRVAGGIVQHPKTLLWQIWMIMEGPCALLGAYYDSAKAQESLQRIINVARHGDASTIKYRNAAIGARHLYDELISQGDGESVQLPYDMMVYLLDHLHLYTIDL